MILMAKIKNNKRLLAVTVVNHKDYPIRPITDIIIGLVNLNTGYFDVKHTRFHRCCLCISL